MEVHRVLNTLARDFSYAPASGFADRADDANQVALLNGLGNIMLKCNLYVEPSTSTDLGGRIRYAERIIEALHEDVDGLPFPLAAHQLARPATHDDKGTLVRLTNYLKQLVKERRLNSNSRTCALEYYDWLCSRPSPRDEPPQFDYRERVLDAWSDDEDDSGEKKKKPTATTNSATDKIDMMLRAEADAKAAEATLHELLQKRREIRAENDLLVAKLASIQSSPDWNDATNNLSKLVALNDRLKSQEKDFKASCRKSREKFERLLGSTSSGSEALDAAREGLARAKSRLEEINKELGKEARVQAQASRTRDMKPSRAELDQYEKRYLELYAQMGRKTDENKRLVHHYNGLQRKLTLVKQETNLLESMRLELSSTKMKKGAPHFDPEQFPAILAELDRALSAAKTRTSEAAAKADETRGELDRVASRQRAYYRALRELHEAAHGEEDEEEDGDEKLLA